MAAKKKKGKVKPPPPPKAKLPVWTGYILLAAGLIAHLLLVVHYDFTQDDAFITFRYAANYLDGHGLVYNIGERVEGFTNFLWTILMILGGRLGLDFTGFSQVLGAACGLGVIVVLFFLAQTIFADLSLVRRRIMAGLCCLVLGLVYSFAYWTVAGLETAAFSFMVIAAIYFYLRRSMMAIPCLVLATMFRPEGGLVFFFILLYEIISRKSLTRYAIMILAFYIIFLLPLAVFKLAYYGSLFPNPFFAKTTFNVQQVLHGLDYAGQYFWHYLAAGIFVIPVLLLIKKFSRSIKVIILFLLIYTLYIILIGGDVLKVHRFFVPLFPLFVAAVIYGLYSLIKNRPIFILTVALLLTWQLTIPRTHIETFHYREKGLALKMILLMNNLVAHDNTNFSVAASTIGMVGYKLLGHNVIDMLGLTDSTIARHPEEAVEGLESTWRESQYNSQYLLSRKPDYILFSTGNKPSAPAERALFLYSAFLNNYRAIGYFLGTKIHNVYKRFGEIDDTVVRDVDVAFAQNFNLGINELNTDKHVEALRTLNIALKHSPQPVFPYIYYYMSESYRKQNKLQESYNCLKQGAAIDTLTYEIYKDLYFYEYRLGNYPAAEQYRSRVANLVPWYMPRLDSLVRGVR